MLTNTTAHCDQKVRVNHLILLQTCDHRQFLASGQDHTPFRYALIGEIQQSPDPKKKKTRSRFFSFTLAPLVKVLRQGMLRIDSKFKHRHSYHYFITEYSHSTRSKEKAQVPSYISTIAPSKMLSKELRQLHIPTKKPPESASSSLRRGQRNQKALSTHPLSYSLKLSSSFKSALAPIHP